jgi:hypothetical protein
MLVIECRMTRVDEKELNELLERYVKSKSGKVQMTFHVSERDIIRHVNQLIEKAYYLGSRSPADNVKTFMEEE